MISSADVSATCRYVLSMLLMCVE